MSSGLEHCQTLGHEFMGMIIEIGSEVDEVKVAMRYIPNWI